MTEQSWPRCAPKYRPCEPLYFARVIFLFCYKNTAQGILAQVRAVLNKLSGTNELVKMTNVSQRLGCDNVTDNQHGVDYESTVLLSKR